MYCLVGVLHNYAYYGRNTFNNQVVAMSLMEQNPPTAVNPNPMGYNTGNILKGDVLAFQVFDQDSGKVASFTVKVVENGVFPTFPELDFKEETHLVFFENGIARFPAEALKSFKISGTTYTAADFTDSKFNKEFGLQPMQDLVLADDGMALDDSQPPFLSPSVPSALLLFTSKFGAKLKSSFSPVYVKSGTISTATKTATLKNGYAVFDAAPDINPTNPIKLKIGDFEISTGQTSPNGYNLNSPMVAFTKSHLLVTSNQSIPADLVFKLVGGVETYTAVKLDEFNVLFSGEFTATHGSYSVQIQKGADILMTLPIKYLQLQSEQGLADASLLRLKQGPQQTYFFNQIVLSRLPQSYTIYSFLESNLKLQYRGEGQSAASFEPDSAILALGEFLANDKLITYVFDEVNKKVALTTLSATVNGEFPAIPAVSALTFTTDYHLLLIENGILRYPASVVANLSFQDTTQLHGSDFSGSKLTKTAPKQLPDSFDFIDSKMDYSTYRQFGDCFVAFIRLDYSLRIFSRRNSFYFKSGNFSSFANSAQMTATLSRGYPVYKSRPEHREVVQIGAFSEILVNSAEAEEQAMDVNRPLGCYANAFVLFTSNQSIPANFEITLTNGQKPYSGQIVDQYNVLFSGRFTEAKGTYSIVAKRDAKQVFSLPIKYLTLSKTSPPGAPLRKQYSSDMFFFNQIFMNYQFPAEQVALLKFPQAITKIKEVTEIKRAADPAVCDLSRLTVTINDEVVFEQMTTNCTIFVYVAKDKMLKDFVLGWEAEQESGQTSKESFKVSSLAAIGSYSQDGLTLSDTFFRQSYLTNGDVAGIVIGSVAGAIIIAVVVFFAVKTRCFRKAKANHYNSARSLRADIQTDQTVSYTQNRRKTIPLM